LLSLKAMQLMSHRL